MRFTFLAFPLAVLLSGILQVLGQDLQEYPDIDPTILEDPVKNFIESTIEKRETAIRGLLQTRQIYYCEDPGYALCRNQMKCCPAGGDCCRTGCCGAGNWCYSTICCKLSQKGCSNNGCCDPGWNCCRDGSCCKPGYTCIIYNGAVRCCPSGTCGGGNPSPTTTTRSPKPPTPPPSPTSPTNTRTSSRPTTPAEPTENEIPETPELPTDSLSASATSRVTSTVDPTPVPLATPPVVVGASQTYVSVSDTRFRWTSTWTDVAPKCNTTGNGMAKKAGTPGDQVTFTFTGARAVYLRMWAEFVEYDITFRNETVSLTARSGVCTYTWYKENLNPDETYELKITMRGPVISSGRRAVGDLQVEDLILATPNSNSVGPGPQPSTPSSSGNGAQLFGPSLTLLALLIISILAL